MPWKDKDKQREAIRKHYNNNRQYYIDKAYDKRNRLREYVYEKKSNTPCTDCNIIYPHYVTDYDHIGQDKSDTISRLINSGSFKKIDEEISKCELVCSNCHRIRTYKRLNISNKV